MVLDASAYVNPEAEWRNPSFLTIPQDFLKGYENNEKGCRDGILF
jgi:hypothetical protein